MFGNDDKQMQALGQISQRRSQMNPYSPFKGAVPLKQLSEIGKPDAFSPNRMDVPPATPAQPVPGPAAEALTPPGSGNGLTEERLFRLKRIRELLMKSPYKDKLNNLLLNKGTF